MATKTIRFDKFRPYYIEVNPQGARQENILDLSALFRDISHPEFHPSVREIWGDMYRFNNCHFNDSLGVWEIQILHLREKILPGMAGLERGYDLIELPEGMYAAESSTMLYDPQDSTLYMQRNMFCVSPKKMEMYLARLLPENTRIALKVIQADNRINEITAQKLYRKVVLVADTNETADLLENSSLRTLLNAHAQYGGKVAHIEFGMGRTRGRLNSAATAALIQEAYEAAATEKLEVTMADPDDNEFNLVNLLEARASYCVTLEYEREDPITHQRLLEACKECYRQEHNR